MCVCVTGDTDEASWLQFDFGQVRHVTGIRTLGRLLKPVQFVTEYKLQYWTNKKWEFVTELDTLNQKVY